MSRPQHTRRAPAARQQKRMHVDQALLEAAERALGVASATEAVTVALRRVVKNAPVAHGLRSIGGTRLVRAERVIDPSPTHPR